MELDLYDEIDLEKATGNTKISVRTERCQYFN